MILTINLTYFLRKKSELISKTNLLHHHYKLKDTHCLLILNCKHSNHTWVARYNARRPPGILQQKHVKIQKRRPSLHSPAGLVAIYGQRKHSGNQILQYSEQTRVWHILVLEAQRIKWKRHYFYLHKNF